MRDNNNNNDHKSTSTSTSTWLLQLQQQLLQLQLPDDCPIFVIVANDDMQHPIVSLDIVTCHQRLLSRLCRRYSRKARQLTKSRHPLGQHLSRYFQPRHCRDNFVYRDSDRRQVYNLSAHQFFGLGNKICRHAFEHLSPVICRMICPDVRCRYLPTTRLPTKKELFVAQRQILSKQQQTRQIYQRSVVGVCRGDKLRTNDCQQHRRQMTRYKVRTKVADFNDDSDNDNDHDDKAATKSRQSDDNENNEMDLDDLQDDEFNFNLKLFSALQIMKKIVLINISNLLDCREKDLLHDQSFLF
jgi:hypothetical protein